MTQPLLGEMRLQWWRDTLERLFAGGESAHPVAIALGEAIRVHRLTRAHFERLVDARAIDLQDGPPADFAALEDYAEGTAASVTALGLEILGARTEPAIRAARHAGIAWALTGLLRAVPFHAGMNRLHLPADLLARHGVTPEEVLARRSSPGLAKIAEEMAERARDHLAAARSLRSELPREAMPGLLTAALARTYLDRLRRARYDLMDARWSAVRPPVAQLAWKAWRGRY